MSGDCFTPNWVANGPAAWAAKQAAQDNHFMHSRSSGGASAAPGGSITQRVLREFAALHHELTEVRGLAQHHFNIFSGGGPSVFLYYLYQ